MFNKLKQIQNLRQQAKSLQNKLSAELITADAHWGKLKVTMDGSLEVKTLSVDESLLEKKNKASLEKELVSLLNDAIHKAQKIMAKKLNHEGGLSELADMLKG